jgi:ABC-type phosphate transport system permease subunit
MINRRQRRHWEEAFFKGLMRLTLFIVLGMLGLIVFTVVRKGFRAMSLDMLTQTSKGGYYLGGEGGILNAIAGSLYLAAGATLLALLAGLPVVFYLHAYMGRSRLADGIRVVFDVRLHTHADDGDARVAARRYPDAGAGRAANSGPHDGRGHAPGAA